MNAAILILAVLVWLVALWGFVNIVRALIGVSRMVPAGHSVWPSLWALCRFDYPAVTARLGQIARTPITWFRKGMRLFVFAIVPFFILIILNIVTGQAA